MAKSRNFRASIILVTSVTADAEIAVLHEMDEIPRGAFVLLANTNCVLYLSTTAWTATTAYVKCNVSGASMYVLFFV